MKKKKKCKLPSYRALLDVVCKPGTPSWFALEDKRVYHKVMHASSIKRMVFEDDGTITVNHMNYETVVEFTTATKAMEHLIRIQVDRTPTVEPNE